MTLYTIHHPPGDELIHFIYTKGQPNMTRISSGNGVTPMQPTVTENTPTTPTTTTPVETGDSFTVGSDTTTTPVSTDTPVDPAPGSSSVLSLRIASAGMATASLRADAMDLENEAVQEMNAALRTVLDENPEIRTNQDIINHAFTEGGGSFAGAEAFLADLGLDIDVLLTDRAGQLARPAPEMEQRCVLCAVLRNHPEIETNQDMINHAFEMGGDFAGAAEYLEGLGLDINTLLADRTAVLDVPEPDPGTLPPEEPEPTASEMLSAIRRRYPNLQTNQDLINHAFEMGGGDFAGATAYMERLGLDISEFLADRNAALPEPGPSPLEQLLEANPDIQTNQDFINFAFAEGGGTFSGASAFAERFGISMDELLSNRDASFDPSRAIDMVMPTDPVGDASNSVTPAQLRQIVPTMSRARAEALAPHISRAMVLANINTPQRKAAFIAQIAHESDAFRTNEEYASGAAYEGRRDLGNKQPGDGRRYKGRGFIQLTGRSNYTRAGRDLGIDLVGNPDFAKTNEGAALVTAWYWNANNLNRFSDRGDFLTLTRRINGGTNGLADRQRYYARARRVFGA